MSQLYDKIFSEEGSLSKEDLLAYLRDELSDADRNRVERTLESSALDREALEGLEESPEAWNTLEKLEPPKSLSAPSNSASIKIWWTLGIAASVISLIALLTWPNQEANSQLAENKTPTETKSEEKEETVSEEEATSVNQEIKTEEKTVPTEKPEALKKETESIVLDNTPEPETANSQAKVADEIENTTENTPDITSLEAEENSDVAMNSFQEIEVTEITEPLNVQEDVTFHSNKALDVTEVEAPDVDYMAYVNVGSAHYKVVNYEIVERPESEQETDNEKRKRLKMLDELSRSTPPRFGNQSETTSKEISESKYQVNLNYDYILNSAITAFHKENNRLALERFDLILNQFPTDQNALFYSSLLLKKQLESALAEERLLLLLEQSPNVFGEEASWELAKLYVDWGKNRKAKQHLESIAAEKGFYSQKAEQLLLEMEP